MIVNTTDDVLAYLLLAIAVIWAIAFLVHGHYERKRVMEQSEADLERWRDWVPDAVQEGTLAPLGLYSDDEE